MQDKCSVYYTIFLALHFSFIDLEYILKFLPVISTWQVLGVRILITGKYSFMFLVNFFPQKNRDMSIKLIHKQHLHVNILWELSYPYAQKENVFYNSLPLFFPLGNLLQLLLWKCKKCWLASYSVFL